MATDEFHEKAHGVLRELGLSADDTDHPDVKTIATALRETARAARIAELEWVRDNPDFSEWEGEDYRIIDDRLAELKKGTP